VHEYLGDRGLLDSRDQRKIAMPMAATALSYEDEHLRILRRRLVAIVPSPVLEDLQHLILYVLGHFFECSIAGFLDAF
jgi:hypothetical protein